MMDWSEQASEGGGYFNESGLGTPNEKSGTKSASRQQFLCPVTVRQVLEAPDEGIKVGNFTATMVTLMGIVLDIELTSTKLKFTLSDDTGEIDCIEWLESDEGEQPKNATEMKDNSYYQVFGCIKSVQGQRRIMVFKVMPVEDFNEVTAFMAEVISANQYAQKFNQNPETPIIPESSYTSFKSTTYDDNRSSFNPIQQAILDEIKATEDQVGWSKKTTELNNKFPKKAMEDALEFLISEGHIYSTIDDDHYCST